MDETQNTYDQYFSSPQVLGKDPKKDYKKLKVKLKIDDDDIEMKQ